MKKSRRVKNERQESGGKKTATPLNFYIAYFGENKKKTIRLSCSKKGDILIHKSRHILFNNFYFVT